MAGTACAGYGGLFSGLVVFLAVCSGALGRSDAVEVITSDNFNAILTGDWMLEFYAPWCPACKQFASTWKEFAEWNADQENGVRVGKVDVTAESILSGQFMVTQLPSIFHIHDGEVRVYSGKRSLYGLKTYVEDEEWQSKEAIPTWRSPTAIHMRALGMTYWLSQRGKDFQTMLEDTYNLPTYAVFIVVAIATIVIGLVLGGITVCCIEVCMRLCSRKQAPPPASKSPRETPRPVPTQKVGGDSPQKVGVASKPGEGGILDSSEHTDGPKEATATPPDPTPVDIPPPSSAGESPVTGDKKPRKRRGKKKTDGKNKQES